MEADSEWLQCSSRPGLRSGHFDGDDDVPLFCEEAKAVGSTSVKSPGRKESMKK